MKIAAGQFGSVLKAIADYAVILLYGEDWGVLREQADAAVAAVLGGTVDAFRLSVLARSEHDRLATELSAVALGGGRRVVRVLDAADSLTVALDRVGRYRADTLVVLEAGSLTPRSRLRAMAERQPDWAAVPCYQARAGGVAAEVSRILREAGLDVAPDAAAFLAGALAGESTIRRQELAKLALYAAADGRVSLEAAQACCAAEVETSLGAAVSAALSGNSAVCDGLLAELQREGASGAGLLAVLSSQLGRLLRLRSLVDAGATMEAAVKSLQPPVYPSQVQGLTRDVQRWPLPALLSLGEAVRDADLACKRAGAADLAIASRLLGAVAARRGR